MLYYGTADNNVHPTNTHQLIAALGRANKGYDLQVTPDAGHSGINQNRLWEYFVDWLIRPGN
jgi:dipeptidyl-peptidase 4